MNLLITGGSSDIAKALIQRRIEMGDTVIITCSNEQSLNQALEFYAQQGIKVSGLVFDFAQPQASEQDLNNQLQEPLDGIVLNAFERVPLLRKFHALPFETIRNYVDSNINGNLWLIHYLLPSLLKNNFGRLVLMSSIATITGSSRYPAYCTAKAALEGLFINLAVDYSSKNILSNILRVGLIKTSRTEHFWKNATYEERVNKIIPQATMGEPSQVAEAMDIFLSKTSYLSGTVVNVSGGLPLLVSDGLLSK
jgi:3-oxoacyl-[acyl-carrier protein] reductase